MFTKDSDQVGRPSHVGRHVEFVDHTATEPTTSWQPPVLTGLKTAPMATTVALSRVRPTAAFSRRDSILTGYAEATQAARRLGFEPVLRTVGGRMAPLHEDSLVIDIIAPHSQPHVGIRDRFIRIATATCTALRSLGVPARVGEVPGEYCPGEFSVNACGQRKLAGTAQRVTRWGYLISTVVVIERPEPLRDVVSACYSALRLPVDREAVGAISEYINASRTEVISALVREFVAVLPRLSPDRSPLVIRQSCDDDRDEAMTNLGVADANCVAVNLV